MELHLRASLQQLEGYLFSVTEVYCHFADAAGAVSQVPQVHKFRCGLTCAAPCDAHTLQRGQRMSGSSRRNSNNMPWQVFQNND